MRVQLNARNRAFRFDAGAGEKILYAGLRARGEARNVVAAATVGSGTQRCRRIADGQVLART